MMTQNIWSHQGNFKSIHVSKVELYQQICYSATALYCFTIGWRKYPIWIAFSIMIMAWFLVGDLLMFYPHVYQHCHGVVSWCIEQSHPIPSCLFSERDYWFNSLFHKFLCSVWFTAINKFFTLSSRKFGPDSFRVWRRRFKQWPEERMFRQKGQSVYRMRLHWSCARNNYNQSCHREERWRHSRWYRTVPSRSAALEEC